MKRTGSFLLSLILCVTLCLASFPYAAAETTVYDGLTELTSGATAAATYEEMSGGNVASPASKAIDDSLGSRWSAYATPIVLPQALQIDLGAKYSIKVLDLWFFRDGREYTYDIYVTNNPTLNGTTFSTAADPVLSSQTGTGSGDASSTTEAGVNTVVLPEDATGRYVTIYITGVTQSGPAALWEVNVWGDTASAYAGLTDISSSATAAVTFAQNGFPASNTIDGQLGTRWSAYGAPTRLPQALELDLGASYSIEVLDLWFFSTGRTYTYDLYITDESNLSEDGTALSTDAAPVLSNQIGSGSGSGSATPGESDMNIVVLPEAVTGRYVTICITDVTQSGPAALWEVRIWSAPVDLYAGLTDLTNSDTASATATFEQTTGAGCPAANAIDGKLANRWSSYGSTTGLPEALQIDLGQSADIQLLEMWWYQAGRTFTYDLYITNQPTMDGTTFSTTAVPVLTRKTGNGSGSNTESPSEDDVNLVVLPETVSGRYVTIVVTKDSGGNIAALWEINIWGKVNSSGDGEDDTPDDRDEIDLDSFENLALTGTAVATAEQTTSGNCLAPHAIDGKLSSRWSTFGASIQAPHAIQVDLGADCRIEALNIWWYQSGRNYTFDIYVTDEPTIQNQVFSTQATPAMADQTGTGAGDNATNPTDSDFTTYILPSSQTGRYVTIFIKSVNGVPAMWEMQILGKSLKVSDIAGFRSEANLVADVGTAQDALALPDTVTALLDDGRYQSVGVTWQCGNYDPNTAGTYTFIGTVKEEDGVTNTQNLTVSKQVILESLSAESRTKLSLNDGWVFFQGSARNAEKVEYNDSAFEYVDLPHTWNAEDGADGGNDYYQGDGWYRRHLSYRSSFDGKRVYLYFEGVNRECVVYVNGTEVGSHRGGYTAFYIDITDSLQEGDNLIAVKANNAIAQDLAPLSGDFTQYGGIYRDVSLVLTGETHVDTSDLGANGLYMTTTNVSSSSAKVGVASTIVNDSAAEKSVTIRYELAIPADGTIDWIDEIPTDWLSFDPADMTVAGGKTIHSTEETVSIAAGKSYTFNEDFTVSNPHLWNGLADPFRYVGTISVTCDGEVTDVVREYIGLRTFDVDAEMGAFLNGKSYNLRGVSRHQDREGMGNALTTAEHNEDFAMIYEMGCNSIRLAHYPQADYFYDLCDQYGLLVWAEIPFVNAVGGTGSYEAPDETRASFFETTRTQMKELIRQQYNHPSIIVWGIHNEVQPQYEDVMLSFCEELADLCREEDPTRLTTQATANASTPNWGGSDLICTNLYPGWYYSDYTQLGYYIDYFRDQVGDRPVGISEYGLGANYEQHCEGDPATVCLSGDHYEYEEYQSEGHESYIDQINQMDYLWCTFVWNMFDFGSDGRYEAQVGGINNKGLVSMDRTVKKDAFYLYKANWSDLPTLHINSSRFTYRESDSIVVKGYSNCDSVSLYVNGELIGTKTQEELEQETVFKWKDVALKAGKNTVKMVGTLDGQEYTDEVEWYYVKVDSSVFEIRELNNTLVLPNLPTYIEEISNKISCNVDAEMTIYAADGETVLTEGKITQGMKLCVSIDGSEFWYTFMRSNLALSATAKATYEQNSCPARYAIDGIIETRWSSYGSTSLPQGIQIDLGQSYDLESLEILWFGSGRTYTYDLYITDSPVLNTSSYPTPTLSQQSATGYGDANNLPNETQYTIIDLPESTKGRYVTIVVTGGSGLGNTVALWEIGIYRAEFDEAKINQAVDAIGQIGEVTIDNVAEKLSAIEAAQGVVNELVNAYGEDVTKYISNMQALIDAQKMADIVEIRNLIDQIGEITSDNYTEKLTSIEDAEEAIKALVAIYGEDVKASITNLEALENARKAYDEFAAQNAYTLGDVNGDGSINASDALMALQHSVKLTTLEGNEFKAANVDGSNAVDATDALYILQHSVKLIDKFPIEQ